MVLIPHKNTLVVVWLVLNSTRSVSSYLPTSGIRSPPTMATPTLVIRTRRANKVYKVRSALYRSRFLQPNTHFAAFFENYKICNPLHRSNFKIWAKFRETFSDFCLKFCKKSRVFNFFHRISHRFWLKFHRISPNILKNDDKSLKCRISSGF